MYSHFKLCIFLSFEWGTSKKKERDDITGLYFLNEQNKYEGVIQCNNKLNKWRIEEFTMHELFFIDGGRKKLKKKLFVCVI